MSSDRYQVQNVFSYSRKTYAQDNDWNAANDEPETMNMEVANTSPRTEENNEGTRLCNCGRDPEGEINNILHKKCPVITLAQQQLQKLLDETDKLFYDNTRCCRSIYDLVSVCKDVVLNQNKCQCVFITLMTVTFIIGIILGAASCGTHLGRFNNPILTCIDNRFIPDNMKLEDSYRSII